MSLPGMNAMIDLILRLILLVVSLAMQLALALGVLIGQLLTVLLPLLAQAWRTALPARAINGGPAAPSALTEVLRASRGNARPVLRPRPAFRPRPQNGGRHGHGKR